MARNLKGQRFGKLVVIGLAEKPDSVKKDAHRYWLCQCDCGNTSIVSSGNLGKSVFSCGCIRKERKPKTHGCASHYKYNRLYHTWNSIKYRCYNKNSKDFKHYGGRGIAMCDEWLHDFIAFQTWALSSGYEEHLTIDRIDVNGNYCPENCRWVTVAENNKNKRKKVKNV